MAYDRERIIEIVYGYSTASLGDVAGTDAAASLDRFDRMADEALRCDFPNAIVRIERGGDLTAAFTDEGEHDEARDDVVRIVDRVRSGGAWLSNSEA